MHICKAVKNELSLNTRQLSPSHTVAQPEPALQTVRGHSRRLGRSRCYWFTEFNVCFRYQDNTMTTTPTTRQTER